MMSKFNQPITMFPKDVLYVRERLARYPFLAQAPTSCKPQLVKFCRHVSVRLCIGWRLWMFETDAERDQFVTQYGGRIYKNANEG